VIHLAEDNLFERKNDTMLQLVKKNKKYFVDSSSTTGISL
jgi:hypothetical protein